MLASLLSLTPPGKRALVNGIWHNLPSVKGGRSPAEVFLIGAD